MSGIISLALGKTSAGVRDNSELYLLLLVERSPQSVTTSISMYNIWQVQICKGEDGRRCQFLDQSSECTLTLGSPLLTQGYTGAHQRHGVLPLVRFTSFLRWIVACYQAIKRFGYLGISFDEPPIIPSET